MANSCSFEMLIKGKKDNIRKFLSAMGQETKDVWMGRGADYSIEEEDYEEGYVQIHGSCKWSLQSALIDDALEMETQRTTGVGNWSDIEGVKKIITLFEACLIYHVNMEAYSSEGGCCFQEHFKCENGETTKAVVSWSEEYNEETGEYEETGGFDNYGDFDLEDVIWAEDIR